MVERARTGDGGLVLVESRSGGGKSRLLDELARRVAQEGVRILRGQGVNESAQRPFQVLSGVVRRLVEAAGEEPALLEGLRAAVGAHADAACAALPDLAAILPTDGERLGPEAFAGARTAAALARLLDAAGADGRPTAVILDDCQWADESTIELLRTWAWRGGREGARNVLVAVVFRSEEVAEGHPLRRLAPHAHIDLAPLSDDDQRRMLVSMAGELPDAAVEAVEGLSEGNPFMVSAVLRGLVESGALGGRRRGLAGRAARAAGRVVLGRGGRVPGPADGAPARAQPAPADRRRGARARSSTRASRRVSPGQGAPEAAAALDEARGRNIVWSGEGGRRWTFVHDKLRESLLARLDADERRELHARAAERIEALDPERVFELAYHFDAADLPARALPLRPRRRRAGPRPTRAGGRRAPLPHRRPRRRERPPDAAGQLRICQGLGEVLMLRGRYDESREQLELRRGLAGRPADGGRGRHQARRAGLQARATSRSRRPSSRARCARSAAGCPARVPPSWSSPLFED